MHNAQSIIHNDNVMTLTAMSRYSTGCFIISQSFTYRCRKACLRRNFKMESLESMESMESVESVESVELVNFFQAKALHLGIRRRSTRYTLRWLSCVHRDR